MSEKLFVGCRARLVYVRESFDPCWHVGAEGRVVGRRSEFYAKTLGVDHEWQFLADGQSSGWPGLVMAYQLEPIQPSGHRSGDYSYTELMDRLKAGEVECV